MSSPEPIKIIALRQTAPLEILETTEKGTRYRGQKYLLIAEVITWETKPISGPSKFRTKLQLQDNSGKIDGFWFGTLPSSIQANSWIKIEGTLQGWKGVSQSSIYRSVNLNSDSLEILTGAESLPQEDPIPFDEATYLPSRYVFELLGDLIHVLDTARKRLREGED